MLIVVSKTQCLRETVPNGGATDRESSVAELCPCALNDGSSRCCRVQAPTTRVCLNHSPISLVFTQLNSSLRFLIQVLKDLISLASTLYDFNTVHNHILLYGVRCLLEVYKTTILYFPFPVSFLQLACVRICWIVPLSTVSLEREI